MLPNFLGIGAQRTGTTWLDLVLRTHSDFYLPTRRKEVHYFDRYFQRGPQWYEGFFPLKEVGSRPWRGEITPDYIFHKDSLLRIRELLPECRLIVSLRNPARRAFSQYTKDRRDQNLRVSFAQYLEKTPEAFERGLYAQQLGRCLKIFPKEKILCLIFEETMAYPQKAIQLLSDFFQVNPDGFRLPAPDEKVDPSTGVRFPRTFVWVRKAAQTFRVMDLDFVVEWGRSSCIVNFLVGKKAAPKPTPEEIAELSKRYEEDITELEKMLGRRLDIWRAAPFGNSY